MAPNTPDRIAAAALHRFNRDGYHVTKLADIAGDIGISQGNLTYHFATKRDLALHLSEQVRLAVESYPQPTADRDIAIEYVEHLRRTMELTWRFRFFLRDRGIFEPVDQLAEPSPILTNSLDARRQLIERLATEGLLRNDLIADLDQLARSLWILSRYWMDYLREIEMVEHIEHSHVELGIDHHLAALTPALNATGRRRIARARSARGDRTDTSTAPRPATPQTTNTPKGS